MLDMMQVAAEEGAEAEARVEVRGEGIALTDLLKIKLRQELPNCPFGGVQNFRSHLLGGSFLKVVEVGSSCYMCVIFCR